MAMLNSRMVVNNVRDSKRQYIVPKDDVEEGMEDVEDEMEDVEDEMEDVEDEMEDVENDIENVEEEMEDDKEDLENAEEDMDLLEDSLEGEDREVRDGMDVTGEVGDSLLGESDDDEDQEEKELSETTDTEKKHDMDKALKRSKTPSEEWQTVASLPRGWKFRDFERPDKKGRRVYIQDPSGKIFPCRRLALRYLFSLTN